MNGVDGGLDLAHRAAASRIADQHPKTAIPIRCFRRGKFNLDADRPGTCAQNGKCLRMRVGIDPEDRPLAAMCAKCQRHALGGGCRLVQQRAVCDIHAGQFGDHCLEIQDGFQTPLRDFGLVRCICGVPGGVFQNVAKHNRRRIAAIIPHANQ